MRGEWESGGGGEWENGKIVNLYSSPFFLCPFPLSLTPRLSPLAPHLGRSNLEGGLKYSTRSFLRACDMKLRQIGATNVPPVAPLPIGL